MTPLTPRHEGTKARRHGRAGLPALILPPLIWLAVFLLLPTALLAAAAFSSEGLKALGEPTTWLLLWRSLRIAVLSTIACLVVAYPVASFIAGCPRPWRSLLLFLVVLPFWSNLLVRTYALRFMLAPIGLINNEASVIIGLVQSFLPFMILPLYASIEKLPRPVLEAARDLGASPLRTFWEVTVPLTMPGIAAGCILVFIPVLGIFALPEFLDERTYMIGNQINLYFMKNRNPGAGSALTLLLMLVTIGLTAVYYRFRRSEGLV